MAELTLEALAKRIEALEKKMAEREAERPEREKDWRRVAGMFTGSEFMKDVDAEGAAAREGRTE